MKENVGEEATLQRYIAMIWVDEQPGRRVATLAASLAEARAKLEAEYGIGTVFDLHNEKDAAQPR
jgi:hypothetical protein